ncbi:MAG: UDP-N-acetylglucosamine 2-epimerase (non-hydrolyzing) [Microbacteriaceae bacterium]|nr:UDP-N-acetylglucosamine 2-epimerase (non-hydrolyzing) [Microbacteriaceae bacterium]
MAVYGTRPEAIKTAPLVRLLQEDPRLDVTVVVTGQHPELVERVNATFGIAADHDLAVMRPGQTLHELGATMLSRLGALLAQDRPDAVLVHGDTSTAAVAALAAYYAGIPVVHLEAGLRSGDLASPFPEEGNRRIIGRLAALHLAPTEGALVNLLGEDVDPETVVVTGNTVIDALHMTLGTPAAFADERIAAAVDGDQQIVLVTAHRREAWSGGIAEVAQALHDVLEAHGDVRVVLPLHPNPVVRGAIRPILGDHPRAILCEPLDYPEFSHLMAASTVIVTDSGGVQEEAPSIGVPVLVTRDTTERPEAIQAGAARLVGTDRESVAAALSALLDDEAARTRMAQAPSPYGDGLAARRALAAIGEFLGCGQRLPGFEPSDEKPVRARRRTAPRTDDLAISALPLPDLG